MEIYNTVIREQAVSWKVLYIPFYEMGGLSACVFVLQSFIGEPVAKRFLLRIVRLDAVNPQWVRLIFPVAMASCMCPMMSLVATVIFKMPQGIDTTVFFVWVKTIGVNLPMALLWQIFIAGPLVRYVFQKIYGNSQQQEAEPVRNS